jgi:predicted lysophospholipase L1 biosynthesis ABC-type transport system permease subunit
VRQIDLRKPAEPEIVLPFARFPPDGALYVLRSERRDPALGEAVRSAVDRLDSRLEDIRLRPVGTWVEDSLARERLSAGLASLVSSTATALAALGLYGILALSVVERRREIALRIALGAGPRDVRSLVSGEALRLSLLGLLLGGLGFTLLSPLLRSLLFELTPADVPTLLVTFGLVAAATAAAALPPSSRAGKTPMEALRAD